MFTLGFCPTLPYHPMGRSIGIEGLGQGSLGYPKGMGFLRYVGNRTNSYVVVFFLAVEKVVPPEKTVLVGASHRTNSPYLFLCRTNFLTVPQGRGSRVGTRIPTQGSLFPSYKSLQGQTSSLHREVIASVCTVPYQPGLKDRRGIRAGQPYYQKILDNQHL